MSQQFFKCEKVSCRLKKAPPQAPWRPRGSLVGTARLTWGGPDELEQRIMYFLTNLNLVVPVVAALAVIIIAIIVICVLRSRNNNISKG